MNALLILAQTSQPAPAAESAPFPLAPFIPIILIVLVFYFIIIRPQQKQNKQRQATISQVKANDRVQTVGGLLATVVEVRDNRIRLKIDESNNTKAWFTRSAIHRVIEDDTKTDDKA